MKSRARRHSNQPPKAAVPENAIASLAWVLRGLGFFSGGAVMIVEFSGNRLLTPLFGNSLYTWTGLIGVILVALSCGDYLGGRLVDRLENSLLLPLLFSLGGLLTALVPVLVRLLPPAETMDVIVGPVLASLAMFFLPGLVLAAVTPVSIRLLSKAYGDHRIGTAAGTVGMSAALGSFVGTFATSYVLIPNVGVREIFVVLGAILIAVGVALALLFRKRKGVATPLLMLWVLGAVACAMGSRVPVEDPGVIFTRDTFYHRISVIDQPGEDGPVRVLKLDSTYEGAQNLRTGELTFEYQHFWKLADVFTPDLKRAVFLGAGAFGMPERVSEHFPDAAIDVVEIDPEVVDVGHRFFNLDSFPHVKSYAEDGRRFLLQAKDRYDLIFGDAYNGVQYVPAHLVTEEFFALVGARLKPDGIYVMNLIGAIEGPDSEFFWNVCNALRHSLPHVMVFGANSRDPRRGQNLILVASAAPLDARLDDWKFRFSGGGTETGALLHRRLLFSDTPEFASSFTDDKNPVEYVVARQVRMLKF